MLKVEIVLNEDKILEEGKNLDVMWLNLDNSILSERSYARKTMQYVVLFIRKSRSIEIERLVVGSFFWQNILKLTVLMFAHISENIKNHRFYT